MDISYKKELGSNYMVIPAKGEAGGYAGRALLSRNIKELLEVHYNVVDGDRAYYYDISGLVPLEKYLAMKQIGSAQLQKLLSQIISIPEKMESFLINDRYILLSPQTIFVDEGDEKLYFCAYPENEGEYMTALRELALYFLRKIDHQDEACVSLAYEFFDRVSEENCNLKELRKICGTDSTEQDRRSRTENKTEAGADNVAAEYDDEGIWDVNPELKDLQETDNFGKKERILKAAGIGAPIAAVIIVGIVLFL